MKKTPIYFVPGLAAGPEIFENLELSEDIYDINYLSWKTPLASEETITNYAMRMCEDIKHDNPVLVGVSFGGIMVQEMSQFVNTKKIIIISSVKKREELPNRFQMAKFTKAYKLFPSKIVSNFENYTQYFLGKSLKKRADVYKKYLSVRSELYLNWAVTNVVKWENNGTPKNILHIHGSEDKVFPINKINNCTTIESGTHVMILTKAKKITAIINDCLN